MMETVEKLNVALVADATQPTPVGSNRGDLNPGGSNPGGSNPGGSSPALTAADIGFLVFMAAILMVVVWLGRVAYLEGMKTEVTKDNGEAWAKWFAESNSKRFKPGFEPSACAGEEPSRSAAGSNGKAAGSDAKADAGANGSNGSNGSDGSNGSGATPPRTWSGCLEALMQGSHPLAELRNPFTDKPNSFAAKCDSSDRSLVGAIVLEKLTPTPPGSAVPATASQLTGTDVIEQKLQLRVTICDKGAYPIRIAETDF